MRLIDADALAEQIKKETEELASSDPFLVGLCVAEEYINEAPTVEPLWDEILVICDNCGHAIHVKRGNEKSEE